MGIRFACFACNETLNIKQELAGKRGKCPQCGQRFRIPLQDQPKADPLDDAGSSHNVLGDVPETIAAKTDRAPATTSTRKTDSPATAVGKPESRSAPGSAASSGVATAPAAPSTPPQRPATAAANVPDPLVEAPTACWYVRPATGGQYGPATADVMRQWLQEQRVGATSLVWREGWATWRGAHEVFPQWVGAPPTGSRSGSQGVALSSTTPGTANVAVTTAGPGGNGAFSAPRIDEVKEGIFSKKKLGAQRRVAIVAGLIVLSVALVAGLVIVLIL